MATGVSSITDVFQSSEVIPDHTVIAAIDFGTSSTGYAFCFRNKDSGGIKLADIQLNKWHIGSASSSTDKAPTSVLLKPDKSFDSFGYKADNKYTTLCDTNRHKGWWFYQKFKMTLYESKLSRDMLLKDAEGKTMLAKDVFSAVIAHLKSCVLEDIEAQNPDVQQDEVLYVLTVPAIWTDAAKQFMREAATAPSVGIADYQLKLVLEPEAASVYCRIRKSRVARPEMGTPRLEPLGSGHKYIIVDLGGGTADIATHEVAEDNKLHEINNTRGDNLGGQCFDTKFLEFLAEVVGEDLFRQWLKLKQRNAICLQKIIEGIKLDIADDDSDEVSLEIPHLLLEYIRRETGHSLAEKHLGLALPNDVNLEDDGQYLVKTDRMRSFYKSILSGVAEHINTITKDTTGIDTVFLVGGLAKSAYVRNHIRSQFPQYKVIIPEDPGVAVLKGAVMLGDKPQMIAGRIARFSYGIAVMQAFVEGKHDERYKVTDDGVVRCDNVFRKMIKKGHVLKYGDTFETTTCVTAQLKETKQQEYIIPLYQSTSENPFHTTEPGCTLLCTITKYPPEGGWPDYCESKVQITVGEAEFKFHVSDDLGRTFHTTVDFMSQK